MKILDLYYSISVLFSKTFEPYKALVNIRKGDVTIGTLHTVSPKYNSITNNVGTEAAQSGSRPGRGKTH
jgi:hypothetical protein